MFFLPRACLRVHINILLVLFPDLRLTRLCLYFHSFFSVALENELLKSIEPPESKQPRTLVPLENYLANLNVASTAPPNMNQENDADHLSEAAYDIVTKFPAISFMHAKMLMFPVKGSADWQQAVRWDHSLQINKEQPVQVYTIYKECTID